MMIRATGLLISLLLLLASNSQAGFRRSLAKPIREHERSVLHRNTRPEALRPENDEGLVPDSLPLKHMQLLLKRAPEIEAALVQRIADQQDQSSPYFHKWLTATQLRDEFGPSESDLNAVTSWLTGHGFTVNSIQPSGMIVDFSGNAGQIREALRTEIHRLKVEGNFHIANTSDPSIPSGLADVVEGIVSLHDFKPRTQHTPRPNYTYAGLSKMNYAVVPADLATIYNMKPLFNNGISGQGQTIALIENSNVYNMSDWYAFRSALGLSSYLSGSLTQIHPAPTSGTNNCTDPGVGGKGFELEATLDAQWASAAAPSAAIVLASCADTGVTFGGLIALQNIVNSNTLPQIISISFGECESANGAAANAAFSAAYQQAVALGTSVFVSSGDSGGSSCDYGTSSATHGISVNGIASTPYNVAVGGTDFIDTFSKTNSSYWGASNDSNFGSALSYIPEIPWNSTCASRLLANYKGFANTSGASSFCNSPLSQTNLLSSGAGGGGPSGCATGSPATPNVVGGSCAGYPKPSWQNLPTIPADGVRDLPDVSLFAGNGAFLHYYVTCDTNPAIGTPSCTGAPSTWAGAGGTSYSSPIWAGFQALINQYTGSSQGNPNPVYYALAASEYGGSGNSICNSLNIIGGQNGCVFYDVTLGDTAVPCTGSIDCYLPAGTYGVLAPDETLSTQAYSATSGWDFATGLGTANVTNLVSAFYAQGQLPSITSSSSASFMAGSSSSFVITTSGFPALPRLSISYPGLLPTGLSFVDNGNGSATLFGTPAAGKGGVYTVQLVAGNGISSATQNFSLIIRESPQITSVQATAFTLGQSGAFNITTSGYPKAAISLSSSLPAGLTFLDNGNGTATLSGTPEANTQGSYVLSILATNGLSPDAIQNFTLTLQQAPAITSAISATMTIGESSNFIVTTAGFPYPSILTSSALPSGVTLADHGNGTASFVGMPAANTNGTYSIALVASNGISPAATQNFTLTVNQAPAITSAAGAAFTVGITSAFMITATGTPKAALSITSPLPSGLTFKDNGDNTATLSGVPSPNTQGSYSINLVATNGAQPDAIQNFNLVVQQSPMLTSIPVTTFTVGKAGSYTVLTTGYPTTTIFTTTELPSGLVFADNRNGTATLSGIAAPGTQGIYAVTVIASNGVSPSASQRVTLTIAAPSGTGGNTSSGGSSGNNNNYAGNTGTSSSSATGSGCDALNNGQSHPDALVFGLLLFFLIGIRARRSHRV